MELTLSSGRVGSVFSLSKLNGNSTMFLFADSAYLDGRNPGHFYRKGPTHAHTHTFLFREVLQGKTVLVGTFDIASKIDPALKVQVLPDMQSKKKACA